MPDIKMENVTLEDVRLLFRNFEGREQQFNSAGDRNFCVILDPLKAEEMLTAGWNVKSLRPREEGDDPERYVKVKVSYGKGRPPRVVLISSAGRIDLGADEVGMLDFADIKNVDLVLNPYPWEVNGNKGVSAYLKTAYVTINEDELELKYNGGQSASAGLDIHSDEDDD